MKKSTMLIRENKVTSLLISVLFFGLIGCSSEQKIPLSKLDVDRIDSLFFAENTYAIVDLMDDKFVHEGVPFETIDAISHAYFMEGKPNDAWKVSNLGLSYAKNYLDSAVLRINSINYLSVLLDYSQLKDTFEVIKNEKQWDWYGKAMMNDLMGLASFNSGQYRDGLKYMNEVLTIVDDSAELAKDVRRISAKYMKDEVHLKDTIIEKKSCLGIRPMNDFGEDSSYEISKDSILSKIAWAKTQNDFLRAKGFEYTCDFYYVYFSKKENFLYLVSKNGVARILLAKEE